MEANLSSNGISIESAMAKWHITRAQAEQLDKMDDDTDNGVNGNGKISGSIYDMAKTYYEKSHKSDNENEANRPKLFNNLVSLLTETKDTIEMMKSGSLGTDETEDAQETEKKG